jgi:hypothetical protein
MYIRMCIYVYLLICQFTYPGIKSISHIVIDVLEGFDVSISTLNELSCRVISISGGLSKCCIWLQNTIKDQSIINNNIQNLILYDEYIHIVTILLSRMAELLKKLHLYSEATKAKCFTTLKPGDTMFLFIKLLLF